MVHLNGRVWPEHTQAMDADPSLSSAALSSPPVSSASSSILFEDLRSLNSEKISRDDHRDPRNRDNRSSRDLDQINDPTSIISSAPSPRRSSRNAAARGPRPLLPRSLKEALQLAELLSKSKLIPKGFETPETCLVGILYGMEVGLSPIAALQRMAVIDGRPTIWGDAALALVQSSGLLQSIREEIITAQYNPESEDRSDISQTHPTQVRTSDCMTAICRVKREGRSEPVIGSFSIEDAKRAGLWQKPGPWTDYPKRMLTMRARAFALRDAFPDVLAGLYIREELEGAANKDNRQSGSEAGSPSTKDPIRADGQGLKVEPAIVCHWPLSASDNARQHSIEEINTPSIKITSAVRKAPPPPPTPLSPPPPHPPSPPLPFTEGDAATLETARGSTSAPDEIKSLLSTHDEPVPLDPETLLDLFDSALCCALDLPTLKEIVDEFAERLRPSPREIQDRAQRIIERHQKRVDELDQSLELNKAETSDDGEQGFKEIEAGNKQQAAQGEAETDLPRGLKALMPNLGLGGINSFRRRKALNRQSRSLASWNARQRLQSFKLKTISPTDLEDREDRELEP